MAEMISFYTAYEVPLLILVLGLLTYVTRFSGYVFLSKFKNIPRSVNAGLEAVPAAVITTLVVPPAFSSGPAEVIALVVAGLACFKFQPIIVIVFGLVTLVALRAAGLS
ncbi:MAG: AzlD domain-containing protein [Salaquimonas sp.]